MTESQKGWLPTQTPNGPLKYVDQNGVTRLTLKQGSNRTPGSHHPHVELRNAQNQRMDQKIYSSDSPLFKGGGGDLQGHPVSRRSVANHTPINWDI